MKLADSAGEWLRLSEHYRKLTDEQLLTLARHPASLTDDAQQVLRNEMSARKPGAPGSRPFLDANLGSTLVAKTTRNPH